MTSFKRVCVLLFCVALIACKQTTESKPQQKTNPLSDDIIVGEVVSLTGLEASFGMSTRNGVSMALGKANEQGGVHGRKFRIELMDDKGKPDEAMLAMTRMLTQYPVSAVIGGVASSRSIAMAPVAQQHKIPMITPSSTHPKVTEIGDYIFRVCFIDPFQGAVMARFARESLKAQKVTILRDLRNEYSMGLAQFFKERFVGMGGQISSIQSYNSGDTDFKSQLTAAKEGSPDLIYLPGYYTDVGFIIRQAREMGITTPFAGGDGWDSDKLYEIGGAALDGSYFSNHYSPDKKDPVQQVFVAEYKKLYRAIPDGQAALGYDAAMVLVNAMKHAKSLNGGDLRDAIAQTKDFAGVTGKISINAERNAVKPVVILKVEHGKAKYIQTVEP